MIPMIKINATQRTDSHIVYPINLTIFINKLVHSLFVDTTIINEISAGKIKIIIWIDEYELIKMTVKNV